jgi:hypothetical protein
MEKYIILVECAEQCIDLLCEFSHADNFCMATITNPFDSTFVITEDNERQSYIQVAKYILDRGRIISVIPLIEKYSINFFRIYIRIEEINRHLSRLNNIHIKYR